MMERKPHSHFDFPMPFFLIIISLFFTRCNPSSFSKESYSFERVNVSHLPDRIPPTIPRSFLPESVHFLDSVELRSGFSNARESYLILETQLSKEEIQNTIEKRSALGDWKLLQKDEEPKKTIYLFEGFIKKSLSVFIIEEENRRLVKYFFKKESSY
ncbi:hypothetical protein LPTSP3_g16530 [Leptospira kobayashii]|uniref:Lipoprotein n=1 Tax=Leptospira kobayashii TaxID=1917830 RepID=A0ABN6KG75_9LEPT|nr:hypothetical protein [Leptospira kobayashii]BDA78723.1 hypothetical protein LPTSP3_g16530 [Leptospira kobayashii]